MVFDCLEVDELVPLIQIELDSCLVVLHNMQVDDLASGPLRVEDLYCMVDKLGS